MQREASASVDVGDFYIDRRERLVRIAALVIYLKVERRPVVLVDDG